jgi:hypothetical protein
MTLIERLETTEFNINSALKSIPPKKLNERPLFPAFARAVHRQAHYMVWGCSEVDYYDQSHSVFEDRIRTGWTSSPKHEKNKRDPSVITCVGLVWNEEGGLYVRKIRFKRMNGKNYADRAGMREIDVDLLFDYDGRTIYGNVAFIKPEDAGNPAVASPLKGFGTKKLYVQRALGKYVDYWAIVNRDYAEALPQEEIERFERNGYKLVRLNITMADLPRFERAVKEKKEKRKTKGILVRRRF